MAGPASGGRRTGKRAESGAAVLPVARVAVDIALAHLDRPFDYLVPERLTADAVAGCRVRVRFSGQLTGGYLLERAESSDHPGRLAALERVLSPEPVLSPEIAALARAVADRYAGTMADVLRLAIPPRHARAEAAAAQVPASAGPGGSPAGPGGGGSEPGGGTAVMGPEPGPWARYTAGRAFLAALADGRAPRAVWSALPGPHWPEEIARAAAAAAAGGRGTLIVVPEGRDLDQVDAALGAIFGPGSHVTLSADLGPAERYRRWLAVRRGVTRVVAGTRAAMFAPVSDLGLVVIWDDGDDLHAEPRAPYPHAREVLALRAHRLGAAALIGGFTRTAEATSLVASGWALAVTAARTVVRDRAAQVRAAGGDAELARDEAARSARLPSLALRTARDALSRGPVLVQVPRRGYVTAAGCERCRDRARCQSCGGPLAIERAAAAVRCRWCGTADPGLAVPSVRAPEGPRPGDRSWADRGRTWPRLPGGAPADFGRRGDDPGGARRPCACRGHPRGGAMRWRRVRRGTAARRLGAPRPTRPPRRRRSAPPLDECSRACRACRGGRRGGDRRGCGHPGSAGIDSLGSRDPFGARTFRTKPAPVPAVCPDGEPDRVSRGCRGVAGRRIAAGTGRGARASAERSIRA